MGACSSTVSHVGFSLSHRASAVATTAAATAYLHMLIIFSLMQTRVTMENGKPGRGYEQTTADTYLPHNEDVHFALKANLLLNKIVGIKLDGIEYAVLIVKCEKHTITLFVLTPGGILLFPIYMPVCVWAWVWAWVLLRSLYMTHAIVFYRQIPFRGTHPDLLVRP